MSDWLDSIWKRFWPRLQASPQRGWGQFWLRAKVVSQLGWNRSAKVRQWVAQHPQIAFLPVGSLGVLLLLIYGGVTPAVAAVAAWITLVRHIAQTDADRQRRITESYSKAVSQLASDKIEERLGGIYTLERISKEGPDDYWVVMETLTSFVRERARKKEPAEDVSGTMASFYEKQNPSEPGGQRTDIAAVLTVIGRRDEKNYPWETEKGWRLE